MMTKYWIVAAIGTLSTLGAQASSTKTLYGAQIKNGAATLTIPSSTDTLVGKSTTDVLTNKDIDGGTASNSSRLTLPKAATATISGLTRKQGNLFLDSTLNALSLDDGSSLYTISPPIAIGATHDTFSSCVWTKSGSSFGDFAIDATCTFTANITQGVTSVGSANDGTPGNNYPGVTFTLPSTKVIKACVTFCSYDTGSSAGYNGFRLNMDGYTDSSIESRITATGEPKPYAICGMKSMASGARTIKLEGRTTGGSGALRIDSGAGGCQMSWSITSY